MLFERKKLIRFHHCDPAGIVFYPQYLVLCNELVEDWFDEGLGINFYKLHAEMRRGVPMRHLEADFLAPSVHGDELNFTLGIERLGGSSMRLAIAAEKDGKVRFKALQTLVWANLDGGPAAAQIDDEWRERFSRFLLPPKD